MACRIQGGHLMNKYYAEIYFKNSEPCFSVDQVCATDDADAKLKAIEFCCANAGYNRQQVKKILIRKLT